MTGIFHLNTYLWFKSYCPNATSRTQDTGHRTDNLTQARLDAGAICDAGAGCWLLVAGAGCWCCMLHGLVAGAVVAVMLVLWCCLLVSGAICDAGTVVSARKILTQGSTLS